MSTITLTNRELACIQNLEKDIKEANKKYLQSVGKVGVTTLKKFITSQSIAWKPLSPSWVRRKVAKNKNKKWINEGNFIRAINYELIPSRLVCIGVPLQSYNNKKFSVYIQKLENERPIFEPTFNHIVNKTISGSLSPTLEYTKLIKRKYNL